MKHKISTRDLSTLPDVSGLMRLCQSLAMLDAILSPDWESRYYSFNAHWASNEYMASMRDGEGNHFFCLFSSVGAILKGFDHEAPMSPYRHNPPKIWAGILDHIPTQFQTFVSEPAFSIDETTFCIWRTYGDTTWQIGNIQFLTSENADGSAEMLAMLDNNPRTYQQWAENYYGRVVNLETVTTIYQHMPLTDMLISTLNDGLTIEMLRADMAEIDYP